MRIFILDDARSILAACAAANMSSLVRDGNSFVLARPFVWDGEKVVSGLYDATDLIFLNPVFDIWILDNDLGDGLEGYEFLKMVCNSRPEMVASVILSCSANPAARENIISFGRNFNANR